MSTALTIAREGFFPEEIGQETGMVMGHFGGCLWKLHEEIFKTQVHSVGINPVKLIPVNGTIEIPVIVRENGLVLGHNAQGEARSELKEQGVQCRQ